ncbi:MAG: DMT family transporter, partial [Pseudomonadota bacterium]
PLSSRWPLLALRGGIGFLALFCYFWAITHIRLADAQALQQLAPVFVAFLSVLLLGERPGAVHYLLVSLCLVGALLVVHPTKGALSLPALVAVLSALFSSGAYISVRALTRTEPLSRIVMWFAVTGSLLALPLVLPEWKWLSLRANVLLITAGLLAAPAQSLMTAAYRFAPAHVASAFSYTNVPLAYLFGLFIWDERPDAWANVGIGLIVLGGVLLLVSLGHHGKLNH